MILIIQSSVGLSAWRLRQSWSERWGCTDRGHSLCPLCPLVSTVSTALYRCQPAGQQEVIWEPWPATSHAVKIMMRRKQAAVLIGCWVAETAQCNLCIISLSAWDWWWWGECEEKEQPGWLLVCWPPDWPLTSCLLALPCRPASPGQWSLLVRAAPASGASGARLLYRSTDWTLTRVRTTNDRPTPGGNTNSQTDHNQSYSILNTYPDHTKIESTLNSQLTIKQKDNTLLWGPFRGCQCLYSNIMSTFLQFLSSIRFNSDQGNLFSCGFGIHLPKKSIWESEYLWL